jgi:hypothetical protein
MASSAGNQLRHMRLTWFASSACYLFLQVKGVTTFVPVQMS